MNTTLGLAAVFLPAMVLLTLYIVVITLDAIVGRLSTWKQNKLGSHQRPTNGC